jgi:hypothetical protein
VTIALHQTLALIAGKRFSRLPVPLLTSHRFGGASAGVRYAAVRRLLSIQTDGQPPREHIFSHPFMQLGQRRWWPVRNGMLAGPGKTPGSRAAHKRTGVPQKTVMRGGAE